MDESEAGPRRLVLILGMHRSGTSFLAGSLQDLGLDLGEVRSSGGWPNKLGDRENAPIQFFQEQVLKANGGRWDDPPASVEWTPAHLARLRALLVEHGNDGVFGYKDPRTLHTIEGWRSLGVPIDRVGIWRDPSRVAASLNARSGMDLEVGIDLWVRYNERLVAEHEREPFPVVCFDWDPEVLTRSVAAIAHDLGISDTESRPGFFVDRLRRSRPDPGTSLPAPVVELQARLSDLSDQSRGA